MRKLIRCFVFLCVIGRDEVCVLERGEDHRRQPPGQVAGKRLVREQAHQGPQVHGKSIGGGSRRAGVSHTAAVPLQQRFVHNTAVKALSLLDLAALVLSLSLCVSAHTSLFLLVVLSLRWPFPDWSLAAPVDRSELLLAVFFIGCVCCCLRPAQKCIIQYNTRYFRCCLNCCRQVQQVAWHPNGLVLATACTDFKCRVVSAIVEEVRPSCGTLAVFRTTLGRNEGLNS